MSIKLKPTVEENKLSRRERKKQALREAIYNCAIKLFSQKGFDKVTVEDITNKVDIAKATFFNYFSSKEAILPHFLSQRVDEVKNQLAEETKQSMSSVKKLQHLIVLISKMVIENELLLKWVLIETFRLRAYQKKGHVEVSEKIRESIEEILREGKNKGEFREKMNPKMTADILESVLFVSAVRWVTVLKNSDTSLTESLLKKVNYLLEELKA
jgi:AcrR family transcriptional regulator